MGIRFSKSIKLASGLKANISKSGVSLSIGKNGKGINIGPKGTFLNLGLSGTGLSYRQKIAGGYASLIPGLGSKKKTSAKTTTKTKKEVEINEKLIYEIDEYNKNQEAKLNIHKYLDKVGSINDFNSKLLSLEGGEKAVLENAIAGDEDTIEAMLGKFLENLDITYKVKANYELEDTVMFVDLDLPEIEDLDNTYPCIVSNKKVIKDKTNVQLKKEYAMLVTSIGTFIGGNVFNLSPYIETVVLSAFTSMRNKVGDLKDTYLYSVKFTRSLFMNTDFSKIDFAYDFINKFENRINMSSNYVFKAITPYEFAKETNVETKETNNYLNDALEGLKSMGYKANEVNSIKAELSKLNFENAGEYIKAGLKLLQK